MRRYSALLILAFSVAIAGCGDSDDENTATPKPDNSQSLSDTVAAESGDTASVAEPPSDEGHTHEGHTHEPKNGREKAKETGPEMMGRGPGGMGRGPGMMAGNREDMMTIHSMFAARDKIERTVKEIPNGAEAITESNDPDVAALIQTHVPAMESRIHENNPLPPMTFHPVFVALRKHADDYEFEYEDTDKGVRVTYTAEDPFVVMLIREHAKLVSRFVKNGMEEIHKPYKLPEVGAATDAEEPSTTTLPNKKSRNISEGQRRADTDRASTEEETQRTRIPH